MPRPFLKRAAAGGLVTAGLMLIAPAAFADTLVYTGPNPNGGHNYVNANTGFTFTSYYHLGATVEIGQSCPIQVP